MHIHRYRHQRDMLGGQHAGLQYNALEMPNVREMPKVRTVLQSVAGANCMVSIYLNEECDC